MKLPAAPDFFSYAVADSTGTRADLVERDIKCSLEHFEKCEKMLRENFTGEPVLHGITRERVKICLDAGDYALNKIPLAEWDFLSGYATKCMMQPMKGGPFYYSEILCALKHYARFYL